MKYLHLVWASLFRKKVRTVLTLLSVMVSFLLYGLLQTVGDAFDRGADSAQADRLITNSRYSIIEMLPISFANQIAAVPGVKNVAAVSWFGGSYKDRPAQFAVFPVEPEPYRIAASELKFEDAQFDDWKNTRDGAAVGASLAKRMGWKLGDRVTLVPDIWPRADGGNWDFQIKALYTAADNPQNEGALLFNYTYFDEGRARGKGTVGWFLVKVADPKQADSIAKQIDAMFDNSSNETKTQSEKAFAQGFAKQFGDIGFIMTSVLAAVFFTILVLTGNTMAQAVRERIPELAVLKTLGFSDVAVLALVLGESLLLTVLGGLLGIGLSAVMLAAIKSYLAGLGIAGMPMRVFVLGIAIMVIMGVIVGLFPALRAMRLRIVDALGGHQ